MNKIYSSLLLMLFSVSVLAQTFVSDGICYTIKGSMSVDVTKKAGFVYTQENLVIPSSVEYKGSVYAVNGIGEYAFQKNTNIKSVTIPESVNIIRKGAFQMCSSLETVEIPESVDSIGTLAFMSCTSLKNIELPSTLKTITKLCFNNCPILEDLVLPEDLVRIEESAFKGCRSFEEVEIPDGVEKISANAFQACVNLVSVDLNNVTVLEDRAFSGCPLLTDVVFPEGLESIGLGCFQGSGLTEVILPSSLKNLGVCSFADSHNIHTVELGGVTSLTDRCFFKDSLITYLEIPATVEKIEQKALYYCSGLQYIIVNSDSPIEIGEDIVTDSIAETFVVYVPDEDAVSAFKSDLAWRKYDIRPMSRIRNSDDINTNASDASADELTFSVNGREVALSSDAEIKVVGLNGGIVYSGNTNRVSLPTSGVFVLMTDAWTEKIMVK